MNVSGVRHLFAYGALRRAADGPARARELRKQLRFVGNGQFQGKLFSVDWYPGAVDSTHTDDRVFGDLYEIEDLKLLSDLDEFEGCAPEDAKPHEYVRTVRTVIAPGGPVRAFIYLYGRSLIGKRRIRSGDYLAHRKESECAK